MNAGVVVDLLVEVHAKQYVRHYCTVRPIHVPVAAVAFGRHLPLQLVSHLRNHRILCV